MVREEDKAITQWSNWKQKVINEKLKTQNSNLLGITVFKFLDVALSFDI